MPAKSKKQQRAAGMAAAAKRGKMPMSRLRGAAKQMAESMTMEEAEKYASTLHKGLPEKMTRGQRAYARARRKESRAHG